MTDYNRECLIRGLVNVTHDIHLLPGDRLRFLKNPKDGSYSIVVVDGKDRWLERFTNLVEINDNDAVIDPLALLDSVSISDTNAYWQHVRAFKNTVKSVRRLEEKQPEGASTVTIRIVAPKAKDGREIMVLDIENSAQHAQNGTGHGDWT
jgi:hypothetical protein